MIINGIEIRKGFNINDKQQEFTKQILAGMKTEETRASRSLDSLIGQTVGIIRTGKEKATIVGTCKIVGYREYHTEAEFNAAYDRHQVRNGSRFDFRHSKTGYKVGYILENVIELQEPIQCKSRGIVIRNI